MQGPGVLIFGNLTAARREATIPTLANGTVTSPSIAFANETTTGVYYDDGFAISARGQPGIRVRASDGQFIARDGYGIGNINPSNVVGLTTGFVGSNATFSGDVFVSGNLKVLGEANVVYGDEYVSNILSITNYAPGPAARIRQFQTGPMLQMRDAANAVVFQVAANMVDFANLTISQKSSTGSTIAKDLAVSSGGSNVFQVSSTGLVALGNKMSVMGSVDSGATRGISLWDASDTNWGIYMSQSGTGKSFSGGVAVPGADFAAHAMRFRAYDTATSGFVWENSSETRLMSLNSGTGHLDVAGNVSAPFIFGNASQMTSVPLVGDATAISNVNAANLAGTFDIDLNFVEGSLAANALYGEITADVFIVPGTINANTDLSGTLPQSVLPITIGNATTNFVGATLAMTTNTKTGATGTVIHDYATGSVWVHTGVAANFTPNFTNVPLINGRATEINIIVTQGATPYAPGRTGIQINGSAITVKWLNGTIPTGTASRSDIFNFYMVYSGSTWTVLAKLDGFA